MRHSTVVISSPCVAFIKNGSLDLYLIRTDGLRTLNNYLRSAKKEKKRKKLERCDSTNLCVDTDVTRRIGSDTGASYFGTTRSMNSESCRSAAKKLAFVIVTLAVFSWQCFTANQHPDLCRLLQFLGQPTASALGHLLHRVFQSSGWPIKSPLTFFPTTPDHGAHDCVVPLCL